MAVEAKNVLVGAPDQATTGAIQSAPLGTDLPTEALGVLDPEFTSSGYISEEGLTLALDSSTADIKDWSGSTVRKILEEFDGTIEWEHLEVNEEALNNYFGDDQVTVTDATVSSGKQIRAALGAFELPRKSWVFRMKDGLNRMLIVVPDGQITERGDIAFIKSDAIKLPVTLTAYPTANGESIIIYTDDGVFTA